MMAVILMTISCSNRLNKNLSKDQLQNYIDTLPEYPRTSSFTREERLRIARTPFRFKNWVDQMLALYKCAKFNECNKSKK
jgi:hypothetical protein